MRFIKTITNSAKIIFAVALIAVSIATSKTDGEVTKVISGVALGCMLLDGVIDAARRKSRNI